MSIPRPIESLPIGDGQGLIKLLAFSGVIASENTGKLSLAWWNSLVKEYFTPKASFRLTLWKDNEQSEAKPFEIGVPVLPRFFLITTQSGVKSMSLTLDGARERIWSQGHSVVECVTAAWTWRYNNGHSVTLRGPLTAHLILCSPGPPSVSGQPAVPPLPAAPFVIKIDQLQFDATHYEKFIAVDCIQGIRTPVQSSPSMSSTTASNHSSTTMESTPAALEDERKQWDDPRVTIKDGSLPGEPVNAFGIPQATMRCLELAESVASMGDLIAFSAEFGLGPQDALKRFSANLKDKFPHMAIYAQQLAVQHAAQMAQQAQQQGQQPGATSSFQGTMQAPMPPHLQHMSLQVHAEPISLYQPLNPPAPPSNHPTPSAPTPGTSAPEASSPAATASTPKSPSTAKRKAESEGKRATRKRKA